MRRALGWGIVSPVSGSEERLKLAEGFCDHVEWRGSFFDGLSDFPVETFHLICQHYALAVCLIDYHDFEGIALLLTGHGAAEHQAACTIVAGRRQDEGRSVPRLRI